MTAIYSSTKLPVRLVSLFKNQKAFLSSTACGSRCTDSLTRFGYPNVERTYRKFYYLTDDSKKESYYDKKFLKNFDKGAPFMFANNKTDDMEIKISPSETALRHQNMKQNRSLGTQHQPTPLRQSQQHVRFYGEYCTKQSKRRQPNDIVRMDEQPSPSLSSISEKPSATLSSKPMKSRQFWRTLSSGPECRCSACEVKIQKREMAARRSHHFMSRSVHSYNPKYVAADENAHHDNMVAVNHQPQHHHQLQHHQQPWKELSSGPECNCMACEKAQIKKLGRKIDFLPDDIIPAEPPTIRQLFARKMQMEMLGLPSDQRKKMMPLSKAKSREWQSFKRAEAKRQSF